MVMKIHVHQRPSGFSDGKPVDFDMSIESHESIAGLKQRLQEERGIPSDLVVVYAGKSAAGHAAPLPDEEQVNRVVTQVEGSETKHHFIVAIDESGMPENQKRNDVYLNSGKGIGR